MPKISKILYIITQSELGGAQHYIFNLANKIPKDSYEVAVAAGGAEELFDKLEKVGIKTFHLKNLEREISLINDFKAYHQIRRVIKFFKPDIIHLNSSKAGILGALAGRKMKIKKIIYTVHGFVFNEPLPWLKKNIYLLAEKFSAKFKNKLICVSKFDQQTGIKNKIAKPEKFTTIYNGIDKIKFLEKKEARDYLKLPLNKKIIGTIANFYSTKGLNYFIKSAKGLVKIDKDLIFVIIGFGILKDKIETQIRENKLQENFILTGKIENAAKYLKAFDIYVCSSVKEGFPFSILEAMQAGLPIISTRVGGIPEMINNRENGILINPAEPKEITKAVSELLENKNLASKMASKAVLTVKEKFNLDKVVEETEKIYRE